MSSLFQPSTPVSPPSLWRRMHHHRGRTSHHGTARRRATRNPFWVCTLAASHPHKQGWVAEPKVTKKSPIWRVEEYFPLLMTHPLFRSLSLHFVMTELVCDIFFFFPVFCRMPVLFSLLIFPSLCRLFFPLQGSMSSGKQGSVPLSQTAEKRPEDPRTLQQRRYKLNHFQLHRLLGGKANK